MKHKNLSAKLDYAKLELISPELSRPGAVRPASEPAIRAKAATWLKQVGHSLLNYFCGSIEPKISITQRREGPGAPRDGQAWVKFRAYDPVSRQHHTFTSEAELRTWLDQRYYQ